MDYLKNPIILGALFSTITYAYMWWDNDTKHKKNPKVEKRPVSYIPALAVGVIVWFLASSYFDKSTVITGGSLENNKSDGHKTGTGTVGNNTSASAAKSYYLVGKNNIRLPATDVFIDLANFT